MAFEADSEGNIIACPLTGYAVAEAWGTALLTRLEFLSVKDGREISGSVQILLGPAQAIELAKLLSEKAERILAQKGQAKPS